ncbi:MAG: O-methyltransferase [Erysipelotrichaceae bacterium]
MNQELETLLQEMEAFAVKEDVPIIQPEGANFLKTTIQQHRVQKILEIGSAIGYSAIVMASVNPAIHIVTVELDEQRYQKAVEYIAKAKMQDRITIHHANALETTFDEHFDMIFIDAAKAQYTRFFERYKDNLSEEGIILTDNLKFHGLVEDPSQIRSRNTRQLVNKIRRYIDFLKVNTAFDTEFYDVGDGIAVSKRKRV